MRSYAPLCAWHGLRSHSTQSIASTQRGAASRQCAVRSMAYLAVGCYTQLQECPSRVGPGHVAHDPGWGSNAVTKAYTQCHVRAMNLIATPSLSFVCCCWLSLKYVLAIGLSGATWDVHVVNAYMSHVPVTTRHCLMSRTSPGNRCRQNRATDGHYTQPVRMLRVRFKTQVLLAR